MTFYASFPTTVAGVSSLNGQEGALSLVAGTGITITPGSGTLTIDSSGSSGANTQLSNLSVGSVAINTDLKPDTDNARFIGSASLRWNNVYTTSVDSGSAALALASGGSIGLNPASGFGVTVTGNLSLIGDGVSSKTLRFSDKDNNFSVFFSAPSTLSVNSVYVLPPADGTAGQVLSTDGSGNLSWASSGGGGSPAGADRAIQFNNSGAFGGNAAELSWDNTNTRFGVGLSGPLYKAHIRTASSGGGGGSETIVLALDTTTFANDSSVSMLWTANAAAVDLGKLSLYANNSDREFRFFIDNGGGTLVNRFTINQAGAIKMAAYTTGAAVFDSAGNISSIAPGTSGNVLTSNGSSWVSSPSSGGGVTTMQPFGSSPNANGATISGSNLTLQPANATNPGGLSTSTQTIAGAKTFSTSVSSPIIQSSTASFLPTVGNIRLGTQEGIVWRNSTNSGNISLLADGNDNIQLSQGTKIALQGASSGQIRIGAPSSVTTYTMLLPSDAGTTGQVLTTDGTGVLSWTSSGGGGANQQLSNLSGTVAINLDLVFDTGAQAYLKTKDDAAIPTQALQISTGDAAVDVSGDLYLYSGTSGAGASGVVEIASGAITGAGSSGQVTIQSGFGGSATSQSGNVLIKTGNTSDSVSGDLNIQTGTISGTASSGLLRAVTGDVIDGASGNLDVGTGAATGTGNSGDINVSAGSVVGGQRGSVIVSARTMQATADQSITLQANGGAASILTGGASANAIAIQTNLTGLGTGNNSGSLTLSTGDTDDVGNSGSVSISTGGGVDADTGALNFVTGVATGAGNTGGVVISSGPATGTGNSGHVILSTGTSSSGTVGRIKAQAVMEESGSNIVPIKIVAGNDTLSASTDRTIVMNAAVGTYTITFPAGVDGLTYNFGFADTDAGAWSAAGTGGDTVDSSLNTRFSTPGFSFSATFASGKWYLA